MCFKDKTILRRQFKKIKQNLLNKSDFANSYHFNLRNQLQCVLQNYLKQNLNYSQKVQQIKLASYINNQNQIMPPLVSETFCQKHKVRFSYCFPYFTNKTKNMKFYKIQKCQINQPVLILGDFNIKVPNIKTAQECIPQMMLVPLICFNQSKHRLGYGGGYYDNYLRKMNKKVFTIGVGLQALKIRQQFQNQWDQSLDVIITQSKVY